MDSKRRPNPWLFSKNRQFATINQQDTHMANMASEIIHVSLNVLFLQEGGMTNRKGISGDEKKIRRSCPLIPRNAANDESVKKNTIKTFVSSPSFQSFKACCCTAGIFKFSHVRHSLEQCPALVYKSTTQGSSKGNPLRD